VLVLLQVAVSCNDPGAQTSPPGPQPSRCRCVGLMPLISSCFLVVLSGNAASSPCRAKKQLTAPAALRPPCCANQTNSPSARRLPPVLAPAPAGPRPRQRPVDFKGLVTRPARVICTSSRSGLAGPLALLRLLRTRLVPPRCRGAAPKASDACCAAQTDRRSAVRLPTPGAVESRPGSA